jgi:hypothetical protein
VTDPAITQFPALFSFLSRTTDGDGLPRQSAKLVISGGEDFLSVCLQDLSGGYELTVTCDHLSQAYRALDRELRQRAPHWVPMRWGEGAKERKKEVEKIKKLKADLKRS